MVAQALRTTVVDQVEHQLIAVWLIMKCIVHAGGTFGFKVVEAGMVTRYVTS